MSNFKPFRCFFPKTTYNRKGECITVPCGKCDACCNRKNDRLRTLCDLETLDHKYIYFVTLTYAPHSLPVARYFRHYDYFNFYNVTSRLYDYYPTILQTVRLCDITKDVTFNPDIYFDKFALPAEYRGCIPYLSKVDIQLFLKRLRKNLNKYSNEKIRYIAVGEYGPKTFRPHYHLLLWFDDDEIQKNIRKSVRASWQHGRVDVQKSKTRLSSYVARYVNSNSILSRFHSLKAFAPFAVHSVRLGECVYKDEIKSLYEVPFDRLVNRTFVRNGRIAQYAPLLSFENGFFPKCYSYGTLSLYERELCYTLYSRAQKEFGTPKVSELSNIILSYLYNCNKDSRRRLVCPAGFPDTVKIFSRLIGSEFFTDNTILSILYTSKRFFFLKDHYNLSTSFLVKVIDNYYSYKDYQALCNQLISQDELVRTYGMESRYNLLFYYGNFELITSNKIAEYANFEYGVQSRMGKFIPPTSRELLYLTAEKPEYPKFIRDYVESLGYEPNFFNEIFFDLDDNPLYKEFVQLNKKIARDAIKHKRQNDANKIFC